MRAMSWAAGMLLLPVMIWGQTTAPAQASAPQSSAAPATTIRVATRLVYVDVVVRDSSGRCVRGLKQADFKVAEDGKPQAVDFFNEHSYDLASAKAAPAAKANAGLTFANVPEDGTASGSINMLLFDMVNTPLTDQQFARGQMLKFLKALPPGQQIALFVLTDRLHMVQSFTGSSDLLVQAADLLKAKPSELIRSQSEMMQTSDIYSRWEAAIGRSPSAEADGGSITSRWAKEDTLYDAVNADTRARITILAFADLAHATSGYSGRKNLLWLSASFPTAVGAYMQLDNPAMSAAEQIGDIEGSRETANLIASMQIAVYPINVMGVQTDFVGAQSSGDSSVGAGASSAAMVNTMRGTFNTRNVLRNNMDNIAHQTGGESFYSTNDLAWALRRGIEDGSNFYTVAYRPQNQNWNGAFRNIHVVVDKKGTSLTYRRGYYAYADQPSANDAQEILHRALQPGTPDSTVLRLNSRVTLPDPKHATTWVDSRIDPRTVEFSVDANGHHHAQLLVLLIALTDSTTQPAQPPQSAGVVNLDLDQDAFADALKRGIPVHQEITLPAGKYRLRFGVCDIENRRMGTLDMPVNVGG